MNHWADYLLFAGFLCTTLGIGVYHALSGGKQRTTEEFIMANRKLKVIPTAISMLVSFQSAIAVIGGTAEMYVGGVQAWIWSMTSYPIAVVIVACFFVPWLYPLKLTSIYKVFELRYGTRDVRIFASVLGICASVIYMASATFAPSQALETATGFPTHASIPIMACVCTIYTALGGMKAVIWTDVLQFLIIVAGLLTILIRGFSEVGGIRSAFELLGNEGRLTWINFSPDPTVRHTTWGFLIGQTSTWVLVYGMMQSSVQRLAAISTQKGAQQAVFLNWPCLWLMDCLNSLVGVAVVSYFTMKQCDPLSSGLIHSPNQILPLFVKDVFSNVPGFFGLFLATLYSGALSTVSSSLSGAAANTWEDILKDSLPSVTDYKASLINKALVITYGILSIGISFLIATIPGPIIQVSLSVGTAVTGPLFGMFIITACEAFSWCRAKGVLIAGIIGFVFNFWLCVSAGFVKDKYSQLPDLPTNSCTAILNNTALLLNSTDHHRFIPPTGIDRFYSISYLWYTVLGGLVTIVATVLICSLLLLCQKKTEGSARIYISAPQAE